MWHEICERLGIDPDTSPMDVIDELTDEDIENLIAEWWHS
jgi:hypothetical protein